MILYLLCAVLLCVGLYGVLAKRNAFKIIVALSIVEYALFLLWALIGYRAEAGKVSRPPIELPGADSAIDAVVMVDPLPQAIVLTAIVIGLAVTALLVSTTIRIYEKYGTLDVRAMRRLKG